MLKNGASQHIGFQAIDATDGITPITSGTPVIHVTKDGGTQAAAAGTVKNNGNGQWLYQPTQAETYCNHLFITFTLAGAITKEVNIYPQPDLVVASAAATAAAQNASGQTRANAAAIDRLRKSIDTLITQPTAQ